MPRIKIPAIKSTITINTGITSYDVSSSISGNMPLIQSQIKEKTNDYINVKNAVNILQKYSNWNGYIKIYTEVENNFNVGDIVYITYTEPTIDPNTVFSLDNNYNNTTYQYYDDPFDENIKEFSFGYKILFVNKYNNELVINRYYNDIPAGRKLSNQSLSKISLRRGTFFQDIMDGVVLYGTEKLLCNVFNGTFSIVEGIVSGVTYSPYSTELISGATVIGVGISTTTDENGYYSLNLPVGNQSINFSATGYTSYTVNKTITSGLNTLNVVLTGGTNSVTIFSNSPYFYGNSDSVCPGGTLTFYATVLGYFEPFQYQWKLYRSGAWLFIGTNNSVFSYDAWQEGDILKCEVRNDVDFLNGTYTASNEVTISMLSQSLTITSVPEAISNICTIYEGETATFTANAICYDSPFYVWYVNSIIVDFGTPIYSSSTLQNGDVVHCEISGDVSNYITIVFGYETSTYPPETTTYPPETSTYPPESSTPIPPFTLFDIFGQLHNL